LFYFLVKCIILFFLGVLTKGIQNSYILQVYLIRLVVLKRPVFQTQIWHAYHYVFSWFSSCNCVFSNSKAKPMVKHKGSVFVFRIADFCPQFLLYIFQEIVISIRRVLQQSLNIRYQAPKLPSNFHRR